jgi:hypothetical protein
MDKEFKELGAIKGEMTKAKSKTAVEGQFNIALQALRKQLDEISKLNEIKELQREITALEKEIEE